MELDSNVAIPVAEIPARADAVRLAEQQNPDLRSARQTLEKAKAGLDAAKDAYIPDITALSKYSYQSGIPFLVHNFGTFGFTLNYDLFDGGRRQADIRAGRTNVASAQVNVNRLEQEVTVQVEAAYDKLEEAQQMIAVAEQAVKVRTEALRLAESQLEQNAALNSTRSQARADLSNANASLLEADLNLYLSQAGVKRAIGQMPR